MAYLVRSTASRWLSLSRLVLATTGQYVLIIVVGTLLSVAMGAGFDRPIVAEAPTAEAFQEILGGMLFLAYGAFCFSWPAAFILLLTLGLLRGYGQRWAAWQRWGLLLAGITLGAFLPVPWVREAWSELIEVSFSWALLLCRPWILAAYIVTLWANRRYLHPIFPAAC